MIELRFGPEDLLRTRFAISPLFELGRSAGVLRDPGAHGMHLPWARHAQAAVADLDLAVLDALACLRPYSPDFVHPPPETPLPDFAQELDRIRATPPDQVAREIAIAYPDGPPAVLHPLLADTPQELERLARTIAAYWDRTLAPHWEAVRAVLEADILHRARRLTATGGIEAFADLHPRVAFDAGTLRIEHDYDAVVDLDGRGLLLVPAAFLWPDVAAMIDPPWQPTLLYPPRGVATLWEPSSADPGALGALLGELRARVLAGLDPPVSTTELAGRLGASPAGVSAHLGVLRRAGLATPRRSGRSVLYARTAAGEALLRAGLSPGSALPR